MNARRIVFSFALALALATFILAPGLATLTAQAQDPEEAAAACTADFKQKWMPKGNCKTNAATHFLGTLDNQPLVFRTNDTERMRIDTSGNVGVGKTNPQRKLHVSGASTQLQLESSNNQTWTTTQYKTDAREWHTGVGGSAVSNDVKNKYYIFDSTASQFRMAIDASGNVGIGTTAPASKLSVAGLVQSTSGGFKFPDGTTQTTAAAPSGNFVKKSGDTMTGALNLPGNGLTVGGNQLVIANGNIGIGTSSPVQKLHVSSPHSRLRLEFSSNQAWTVTEYKTDDREWHAGVGGSAVLNPVKGKYYIFDGTAGQFRLVIDTNGNVGIGTTDRQPRLVVHGWGNSEGSQSFVAENVNGEAGLLVNDNRTVRIGTTKGTSSTHTCYAASNDLTFATCYTGAMYVPSIDGGNGYPESAELVSIAPTAGNPQPDQRNPFVVQRAAVACDPNLVGFISDPAKGADGEKLNAHYLPLALSGSLPVKVTMENGWIHRGDLLTSSSKPGYAMKATDACKTVGYALEDATSEGTIQVMAQQGDNAAGQVASLRGQVEELSRDNVSLKQANARLEQANTALEQQLAAIETRLSILEGNVPIQARTISNPASE